MREELGIKEEKEVSYTFEDYNIRNPEISAGSVILGSVRGSSKEVVPTSRWSVSLVEGLVLEVEVFSSRHLYSVGIAKSKEAT